MEFEIRLTSSNAEKKYDYKIIKKTFLESVLPPTKAESDLAAGLLEM
ncbi:hypothetical protein [Ferruginibacter sp.]|nr:hypothetical protein [Ferruginibacter sp.]